MKKPPFVDAINHLLCTYQLPWNGACGFRQVNDSEAHNQLCLGAQNNCT